MQSDKKTLTPKEAYRAIEAAKSDEGKGHALLDIYWHKLAILMTREDKKVSKMWKDRSLDMRTMPWSLDILRMSQGILAILTFARMERSQTTSGGKGVGFARSYVRTVRAAAMSSLNETELRQIAFGIEGVIHAFSKKHFSGWENPASTVRRVNVLVLQAMAKAIIDYWDSPSARMD